MQPRARSRQRSADSSEHALERAHELFEAFERQRLRTVGQGRVGLWVHLDDQTVSSGGRGGQRHWLHQVAVARAVHDTQQLPRALGLSAFAFAEAAVLDRASPLVEEAIATLAAGIELLLAVVGLPALAEAARLLGRSAELRDALGERYGWSRWADAARAIARDDFIRAAEVCEMIGSLPDEALCRLRAAERLADDGQQSEADEQLGRALAFYRSVGATRFIRKAEALLAV